MVAGIYLITNKINGHMYVGGSVNIENRFKEHKRGHDFENSAIDKAIKKYGADSFTYQIITELPADWKIISKHEKYWVKFYNTFEDKQHYNLTIGGQGLSGIGFSEEHKQKISKSRKGKCCGEENGFYNKNHSISQKESWSKSRSIKQNTTGFYHVTKHKNDKLLQGFSWLYQYYDGDERKRINSVDFFEFKKKIESKGLIWKIIDIDKAIDTVRGLYD